MASYKVDTTHSEVGFSVRHMMFAKVRGHFGTWSAEVVHDPANPKASTVRAEIDAASIDTGEAQRDGHLASPDFFDAAKYPKLTFVSKGLEAVSSGYRMTGDLTIRDVTRELTVNVEATGTGKDPWGNTRLGYTATASISRADWGLKWNQVLETGGVLVSDKVEIEIEVQVIQTA